MIFNRRSSQRWLVVACWLFAGSLCAAADEPVDYSRDIKPIFKERCYACHGALKQQSGLRVDTAALVRKGGDSGPAVELGNAEDSLLVLRVTADDIADRMPPEGKPLTEQQIALVRRWIKQGAAGPADEQPESDPRQHWAFQRPVRPAVPRAGDAAALHPIDALIVAERERRGLKPVGLADKRLLLRRVYLDLIGLPPTREQLQAFVDDTSSDAYERVVDRLLDSPQYGERWGRHWMDVWRYSDWFGLGAQLRNSQKHIWHWRDWIIESLNADKGYDRMVLDMLAADETAPTDRDALRATGFLARNYFLFNRTTWLDDTIEHTSKAFLGLTMNCTKCHDHKYDPITQADYYRMRAFFEPHQVRLDPQPGETDLEKNGLPRVFDAHPEAPTYLFVRGDEKNPDKSRVLQPGVPATLAFAELEIEPVTLPLTAQYPSLQDFVLADHLRVAEKEIEDARAALAKAQAQLAETPSALTVLEKTLAAASLRPAVLSAAYAADLAKHQTSPPDNLPQLIRDAASAARSYELAKAEENVARAESKLAAADDKTKAQAEKDLTAARTQLDKAKQAVGQPGEQYPSLQASLKALEGPDETDVSRRKPYPQTSTGRRTALARWIASEQNPLTARVAVNHIWMRHFGQPLVETPTDFGRRAKVPPQQALLDWLAVEFMESGWSMKHLHRLIVTSRAYQLSSSTVAADPATQQADPDNQYYWRRLPVRMESEVVRDSLLHLAGVLDPAIGGPTVDPVKEDNVYRRSLYFTHSRDDQQPFLSMFDGADILDCYRRSESIVPQQALTLANSKLSLTMARKLAARLQTQLGETDDAPFIAAAFEAILCVQPTPEETTACLEALAETKATLLKRNQPQAAQRARENLVHALLNHNDFITIR
jgi:mono/diheme cytochrome c family protein